MRYDDSTSPPSGTLPAVSDVCTTPVVSSKRFKKLVRAVDWHDPAWDDVALVVRVNGQAVHPMDQGACMVWSVLAASDRFEIVAPQRANGTAPIPGFDVCAPPPAGGTKVSWTPTPGDWWSGCLETTPAHDQAGWALAAMETIDSGQRDRIQGLNPANAVRSAWWNGWAAHGKSHIYLGTAPTSGEATRGGFKASASWLNKIDPSLAPYFNTPGQQHGLMQTTLRQLTHEYTHKLDTAWSIGAPNWDQIRDPWMMQEAITSSVEYNLCLFDLPGMPSPCPTAQCCMTAGRADPANQSQGIFSTAPDLLHWPAADLLHEQYSTAPFWRYVCEQNGYPSGSELAHPMQNTNSIAMRPGVTVDRNDCNLGARFPDEGIDLIGLLFERLANPGNAQTGLEVTDDLLQDRLGRSLPDVIFDFHTALYLKDYNDAGDERWRLDWVGDYTSASLLEDQKPFDVPADLYGKTKPDKLVRGYRILDGWGACAPHPNGPFPSCSKVPWELGLGDGRGSTQPIGLSPWGTAVASVRPHPAWAAAHMPVIVRASRAAPLKPLPRFRVFKIQRSLGVGGKTKKIPVPVCGTKPAYECAPSLVGNVTVPVDVDADTEEVLLLASGNYAATAFQYSIGKRSDSLVIAEPTTSLPANIGTSAARRSFLIRLSILDEDGFPPGLEGMKSAFSFIVHGPSSAPCTLTADNDPATTDDFAYLGLSGGNALFVATVPPECYPPGDGLLDLDAVVAGVTATQPAALRADAGPYRQSTVLVLDKSASMADGGKLGAAKMVTKLLVSAMVPADPNGPVTDDMALVAFRGYADTVVPAPFAPGALAPVTSATESTIEAAIDGIVAHGGTSIGDGVLEGQSALAWKYDPAGAVLPSQQAMVVLSDGMQNEESPPLCYYTRARCNGFDWNDPDPNIGGGPDNGVPWTSPLSRPARSSASLSLPRVSAVAFGLDADLGTLGALATSGGGDLVYVPEPDAGVSLKKLTLDLGDGLLSSLNSASDTDRVMSMRLYGLYPGPLAGFTVDPESDELRVTALSSDGYTNLLRLVDPMGVRHLATAGTPDGRATAFRIASPTAGSWLLEATSQGPQSDEPSVLVEVAVRARARLYASADVAAPIAPPSEPFDPVPYSTARLDDGRYVGSDVLLLAAPTDGVPLPGCWVSAQVSRPNGVVAYTQLFDDGRHDDQAAADGVYAFRFTETSEAGPYDVRIWAYCFRTGTAGMLMRERHLAFALHMPTDTDGDGLPDVWELRHGLDPTDPVDATTDPDHDGLTSLDEFRHATDPHNDDTDGGGENDGSEVGSGSTVRNGHDDRVHAPALGVVPGNQRAYLWPGISLDGIELELESATTAAGPYVPDSAAWVGSALMRDGLMNDREVCFRMRARPDSTAGGTTGGSCSTTACSARGPWTTAWSPPKCVSPRVDPDPARTTVVGTERLPGETRLFLELEDGGPAEPVGAELDRGVTASGVAAVRFDTAPSFTLARWLPIDTSASLSSVANGVALAWEPTQRLLRVQAAEPAWVDVWVQLADAAGNIGRPVPIPVHVEAP